MLLSAPDPASPSQAHALQAKVQLPIKNVYSRRNAASGVVDFLFSEADG